MREYEAVWSRQGADAMTRIVSNITDFAITDFAITDFATIPAACRERFFLLDDAAARPLRERGVFAAGLSDLSAGFAVGRVAPPFHIALWTIEGGAHWQSDHQSGALSSGDWWFAPAGSSSLYRAHGHWKVLWFHLEAAPRRGSDFQCAPSILTNYLAAAAEAFLFETTAKEARENGVHRDEVARSYAEILAAYLDRELKWSGVEDNRSRALDALWNRVDADLNRHWTLNDLAAAGHLSPSHLHRLCRSEQGASPLEIVTRLRMRRAQAMLRATDYTLEHIAHLVGYASPFSFSRAFKRHSGCSPQAFRRGRK
jgi:AraC-like DNA-binding protein